MSNASTPSGLKRIYWRRPLLGWLVAAATLVFLINLLVWWQTRGRFGKQSASTELEAPSELSFNGSSDSLRQTEFVPTLDSPLAPGTTALWCATFPLAWQQLKNDVAKGPIGLKDVQAIADRLNRADVGPGDIEAKDYYAAAGLARDGIVDRIRREMAAKFPDAPTPTLDERPLTEAVAFAYLHAQVEYQFKFHHDQEPLHFKDAQGQTTPVHAFGISERESGGGMRDQVTVLFREGAEFAIDLSSGSQPYQILVAKMPRKETLAAMVAELFRVLPVNAYFGG